MLPERAVDRLPDGEPRIERDEDLPVQVGGRDELPPGQPMTRVTDERHRLGAQRHDRERTVGRWVGHDPDVRLALEDRLHHLVRMQALELDARLRIARHEALHVAAHVVEPDRVDGGDADRPVHARLHRRHPRLRLLPRLEEAPTRLVEGLTLRRDDEWALRPVHERHAELRLEQLDRLARRRLGDEVLLRPAGERAEPDDVAIEAQRLEMHAQTLLSDLLIRTIQIFPDD